MEKLIDTIVVTATTIGAGITSIVVVLRKLKLITFGKVDKMPIKCPTAQTQCAAHPEIVKKLNGVRDKQLINIEILNQHTKNHLDSKIELQKIKDAIHEIGKNVAVLKDRSDREHNG